MNYFVLPTSNLYYIKSTIFYLVNHGFSMKECYEMSVVDFGFFRKMYQKLHKPD